MDANSLIIAASLFGWSKVKLTILKLKVIVSLVRATQLLSFRSQR